MLNILLVAGWLAISSSVDSLCGCLACCMFPIVAPSAAGRLAVSSSVGVSCVTGWLVAFSPGGLVPWLALSARAALLYFPMVDTQEEEKEEAWLVSCPLVPTLLVVAWLFACSPGSTILFNFFLRKVTGRLGSLGLREIPAGRVARREYENNIVIF